MSTHREKPKISRAKTNKFCRSSWRNTTLFWSINSEWNGQVVMPSINGKNQKLVNKVTSSSVKTIFFDRVTVKKLCFALRKTLWLYLLITQLVVGFIWKHVYFWTIIKELNVDFHLSHQDDNNSYKCINKKVIKIR